MPPKTSAEKTAEKAKAKAEAKNKAKAEAAAKKEQADLKRKQSNLVTQGKVALQRLEKHESGEQVVPKDELSMLQAKVKFFKEYQGLPRNDNGKPDMLASWELDKTGLKWLSRTKDIGQETKSTENESSGYLSRSLAIISFL